MKYGLRSDSRQWLIYDDETMGALMRGLEAYALHIVGGPMTRHQNIAVRGIGTLMRRTAAHRIEEMKRNDGAQRVMISHLEKVFDWLGKTQSGLALPTPDELDEVYAVAFNLDSRAQSAGVGTPLGTHRVAVRGD